MAFTRSNYTFTVWRRALRPDAWRRLCLLAQAEPAQPRLRAAGGPMSEREVDAELVARVQRGDKKADLLVLKYQRKILRLLARMIRDPSEIEDVAQEAFIKAYRALLFRGESAFTPGCIASPSIRRETGWPPRDAVPARPMR